MHQELGIGQQLLDASDVCCVLAGVPQGVRLGQIPPSVTRRGGHSVEETVKNKIRSGS
jgi:hypothetical protein